MKKLTIALAISFSLLYAAPALAQAPALINYQGKLTDAKQKPVDGPTTILFSIYDAETGGTLLWSQYSSVTVNKGIFNAVIGGANLPDALAGSPETWLEVGLVGDYPMTPRQRLVSVAYSIQSKTAQTADDVPGKDITPSSVSITTSPGATKEVINNLGEWTGVNIPPEKLVESDPQVEAKTTNRIPKWDGGTGALVDSSSITETADGNVGIGTAAAPKKLTVEGEIKTTEGIRFPDGNLQKAAGLIKEEDPEVKAEITNRISKWNGAALVDSTSINETAGGKVGIGTDAPGEKLSVAGKIQTSEGIVFPDGSEQTTAGVRAEADPSVPASIKTVIQDGRIDFLTELAGVPESLKDGDQVGITSETDPQVGNLSTNSIPKWNGSQLVNSSSVHENGSFVGIGTTSPHQKLDVVGNIKVGFASSTCDSANAGSLRWNTSKLMFEGCNGTSWLPLASVAGGSNNEPQVHWKECRIVHANQGTASCSSGEIMVSFNTDYMGPIPEYCTRSVKDNSVTATCKAQYFSYDWHTVGSAAWAKCCAYY